MNNFLNNLERKLGKYAIPNLTIYVIGIYVIGYVLQLTTYNANTGFSILDYLSLNPYFILHGQIWRLITWVIIPPDQLSILVIITLMFYYFIGSTMERTMGTFRYNFFLFGGAILMIIAAFASMAIYSVFFGFSGDTLGYLMQRYSTAFSTYYIQISIFMAFAICYPNLQVLLMFIIPIKVKYLGILYAVLNVYTAFVALVGKNYFTFFAIVSQVINLGLFYLQTGKGQRLRPKEVKRRNEFKKNTKIVPPGVTRHKCAVCGRTELDDPNLEFRFCSKCNGNYEYCQDHLFTHQHIK